MRQTLSKGMVAAAAATSILSLYGSQAFADSHASGVAADSPGVLSGNNVQAPVSVPVNACGNSVDVAAGLNPAFGNSCANSTGKHRKPDTPRHTTPDRHATPDRHGSDHGHGSDQRHGSGPGHRSDQGHGSDQGHRSDHHHGDGSSAHGVTHGSPGVVAGNGAAAPVDVPVNACGNTADVIGLLNPAFGNKCASHNGPKGYGDDGPDGYGDDGPDGYGDDENPPTGPPSTPPAHPPTTTPPTEPPTGPPATVPPGTPHQPAPPSGNGHRPELAHTGSDGMLAASAAGVGLLLGGVILYRRNRAASRQW